MRSIETPEGERHKISENVYGAGVKWHKKTSFCVRCFITISVC